MAKRSALVPSMTRSVRRRGRASIADAGAADSAVCQAAKQLAAGRIEGALLGFGLAMREQRPAVVADEAENDLLDRQPPEAAVDLQLADNLTAENPDIVAVSAQGLARQREGEQLAEEWLEAFHHALAVWNVAFLVRPAARPLIEIRTEALQGIGGGLLHR
jgi:hypothetical protein